MKQIITLLVIAAYATAGIIMLYELSVIAAQLASIATDFHSLARNAQGAYDLLDPVFRAAQ
jgi:hypothetical protein